MKTFQRMRSVVVLTALLAAGGCATPIRGGSATVEFVDPQSFGDLQAGGMTRAETIKTVLPRLQAEVEQAGRDSLLAGYALSLRITNLVDAGLIPNPGAANPIRIVPDSSPAVVAFDYTVTGPGGQTVRSGTERLVQTSEGQQAFLNQNASLPLVELMLKDWISQLGRQLARNPR